MTEMEAMVTSARRYCQQNYLYWSHRYQEQRNNSLFPRYLVLSAILNDVERLVGKKFRHSDDCRAELVEIGLTTTDVMVSNPALSFQRDAVAATAIDDERQKFIDFIQSVTADFLATTEPLPYRRRFNEDESVSIRQMLLDKWNYDGGYWYPLVEKSREPAVFVMKGNLTEDDFSRITDFITDYAAERVIEMTEERIDAEIELTLFHLDCYETIYCDKTYEWIIYGSHEGTISFGGSRLVEFMENLFASRKGLLDSWDGS